MSREMFTCPKCEQSLWLPPDAPVGTPCPHCGHRLGVLAPDLFEWPPLLDAESIDLAAMVPSVGALESVPEAVARKLGVFPVDLDEGTLVLAVPFDLELAPGDVQEKVLDEMRFVLNRAFRPVIALPDAILSAIDLWYR